MTTSPKPATTERSPRKAGAWRLVRPWKLSFLGQFSLLAFFLTAVLGVVLARGLQYQLERLALRQAAEAAAEQVVTRLGPYLHSSDLDRPPGPERYGQIDTLIRQNVLQAPVVRVKIWTSDGTLVYSDERDLVGRQFPVSDELEQALSGTIATEISPLTEEENVAERGKFKRLMEVYVPLRPSDSTQIEGAFELYQDLTVLEPGIAEMRRFVAVSVGAGFILLYGALFVLVRNASRELIRRNEQNIHLYGEAQQRLAESERAEAKRRASEERFARLLDIAPDAIISVDERQRIILFNQGAEVIFGYTARETLGQHLDLLLPPRVAEAHRRQVTEFAASPQAAQGMAKYRQVLGRRKDGAEFPAEASISKLVQGGQLTMTVILRDVSERAHAQGERERLLLTERKQRHLAEALGRVALALNATLDLPELLELICHESALLFRVQTVFVWLVQGTDLVGFSAYGEGRADFIGRRVPLADPLTLGARVIREHRPIYVNDVSRAIQSREVNAELIALWHIRSILGVPLMEGERAIGSLIIIDTQQADKFDQADVETARLLASHAASAVDNARLFDETRRRLADLEAVNRISVALRAAQSLGEMLPQLMDITLAVLGSDTGAILLHDPVVNRLRRLVARGWLAQIAPEPVISHEGIAGHVFATGETYVSADFAADPLTRENIRHQIPSGWGGAGLAIRTATEVVGVMFVYMPSPRELTSQEIHLLTTIAEMAGNTIHRMQLHEQTEARLQRLDALRTIDNSISTSLDLRLTLNVLLAQITTQLRVDVADVLLLNAATQMLEYTAGRGFRTAALQHTRLQLGEGHAGRAALERRIVYIADLRQRKTDFLRSPLFAAEQFVSYYGVPLIAKGEVRGVLEVYQRSLLAADPEWLSFLETLAGQAAIAIDNAVLFENVQRSNVELALAYNATIEGWSRALELRDEATEGHTRRVTDMTWRLARALGMEEGQLVHVRRGALLHDIGKMGIPDSILLKPGALTAEEWEIMRRHPGYAHEMLSSVAYLSPALDIPYCHHEKWDGTGYPRGLKGDQIPLAARIFAVADVWDALRSERPYRSAWPEAKVLEHIQSQAGKHFDPSVVEVFVAMMSEVLAPARL